MMKKILLFLSLLLCAPKLALADCDFSTGEWASELANPRNINRLSVDIDDYRRWTINGLRILSSGERNIQDRWKRRFNATLTVNYDFGTCSYSARVRQSGDWLDHIELIEGGHLLQSLDISLVDGNVNGMTRFKLFIPGTRVGHNEIFATILARSWGFISPETFEVEVAVNGHNELYLLQERPEKELLERLGRREGPIFEGDETLLWDDLGQWVQGEAISLVRLTNDNWAASNYSSASLALRGYLQLVYGYMHHGEGAGENPYTNPRFGCSNVTIDEFAAFMVLGNGLHGLRPHNRSFYYNAMRDLVEPIYYDGNMNFAAQLDEKFALKALLGSNLLYIQSFLQQALHDLADPHFVTLLQSDFDDRIQSPRVGSERFSAMLSGAYRNASQITQLLLDQDVSVDQLSCVDGDRSALAQAFTLRLSQFNETSGILNIIDDNLNEIFYFSENLMQNQNQNLNQSIWLDRLVQILSRDDTIPAHQNIVEVENLYNDLFSISFLDGFLVYSGGVILNIDWQSKTLLINSYDYSDWVLLNGMNLSGWSIEYTGNFSIYETYDDERTRYNRHGQTGCLTIYDSTFRETKVVILNAVCEDGINIVSSSGQIDHIKTENTSYDAIDIDFSNVSVDLINVTNAGNDCVDISYGVYSFSSIQVHNCNDKGLSAGEASSVSIENIEISDSIIGIASKDGSYVHVRNGNVLDTPTCLSAYQKKQEFSGALIEVIDLNCNGFITADENSLISIGD